jgi:hypothetical protein
MTAYGEPKTTFTGPRGYFEMKKKTLGAKQDS